MSYQASFVIHHRSEASAKVTINASILRIMAASKISLRKMTMWAVKDSIYVRMYTKNYQEYKNFRWFMYVLLQHPGLWNLVELWVIDLGGNNCPPWLIYF